MDDRIELLRLTETYEAALGASRITDWLSPAFFSTTFRYMWALTSVFQPWHSAIELQRYLHRFMMVFCRIETLAGVKRTAYNQFDSLVRQLLAYLEGQGVKRVPGCAVTLKDPAFSTASIERHDKSLQLKLKLKLGVVIKAFK